MEKGEEREKREGGMQENLAKVRKEPKKLQAAARERGREKLAFLVV